MGASSLLLETWVWTKEEMVRQHYVASLCLPLADVVETWSVIRELGTAPREIGSPGGMSSDEAEDLVVGISEGSHVNRVVQIARTMATFVSKTSPSPGEVTLPQPASSPRLRDSKIPPWRVSHPCPLS